MNYVYIIVMKKYSVELPEGTILYVADNIRYVGPIYDINSTSFMIEFDNDKQFFVGTPYTADGESTHKLLHECRENILKCLQYLCVNDEIITLDKIKL